MKFKAPIDIHEATVEHFQPRDTQGQVLPDAVIGTLAVAVKKTRENTEALVSLADALSRDKAVTPEANALRLRDSALRLAEASAKKLDEAKAHAEEEIAALEQRIGTPPPPRDQLAVSMEVEIRSRLATMSDADRDKAIEGAFANKDQAVLSAVVRGAAFLSGMSPARYSMARHRYGALFHPEEMARRDRLKNALDATERSGKSFINFVTLMATNQTVTLAEAHANARAAEQAIAAATL